MSFIIHGICASKGIAIGRVYIVDRGQLDVSEYNIGVEEVPSEVRRFEDALIEARQQLRGVREHIPENTTADIAAFIDTHLLMLEDSALTLAPVELIRKQRYNAEWALKVQRDALVSVFEEMDDPYLSTRKDDVIHVANRIQRILMREEDLRHEKPDGRLAEHVVIADDLTPADTVMIQHQQVAGFVTEFGGPTSHTAILARSLRIPALVGLHEARQYLRDNDLVVVDGRAGAIIVNPDERAIRYYRARQRDIQRHHAARTKLRGAKTITRDGSPVGLQANIELPGDIPSVRKVNAAGVGLYRTEFLFMNREKLPDEEEQFEAYAGVVRALRGSPVTIRTLDLGADKQVDGAGRPGAPLSYNPALGLRAIRMCLKEPALFRPQLRAILRASAFGKVRMMVPMVSNMAELYQVIRILDEVRSELSREGRNFDSKMPIGAMIEVPAAALVADHFAQELDFLSIGTNDLIQYTIAIDRVDDEVNYLYDPLHLGVLRLIDMVIKAGKKAAIPVSMCGEMAGNARFTRLLLGMGLTDFSVPPTALLEIKQVINSTDVARVGADVRRLLRARDDIQRNELLDRINRMDDGGVMSGCH